MFYSFGGPRASTLLAWHAQGLPESITDRGAWNRFVGTDPIDVLDCVDPSPLPPFGGGWTEELPDGLLLNVTPLRSADPHGPAWRTVTYRPEDLPTPGFETHRWIEYPVTDRESFGEVARHFDPGSAGRLAADWLERAAAWMARDRPLTYTVRGLWMRVRDWILAV